MSVNGEITSDSNNRVGVIDFNESGLLDEARDFMDVSNGVIRNEMLNAYGASKELREKVEIRRDIRSLIVLKAYLTRNNPQTISTLVEDIRKTLTKYSFLLDA